METIEQFRCVKQTNFLVPNLKNWWKILMPQDKSFNLDYGVKSISNEFGAVQRRIKGIS
jgi:hypothetical protein